MPEPDNVRAVLRGYDALNASDFEAAGSNLSPDFEFTLPPMLPDYDAASPAPEEFRRVWLAWSDQFEDFRIEVEEALDAGDGRVLVMAGGHGIGKGSGAEVRRSEVRPDMDAEESRSACSRFPTGLRPWASSGWVRKSTGSSRPKLSAGARWPPRRW